MTHTDTAPTPARLDEIGAEFPWASLYTVRALAALGTDNDLTVLTPPQVDEIIRTVQLDQAAIGQQLTRALQNLHLALGHDRNTETTGRGTQRRTRTYWTRSGVVVGADDAEAEARALPADTPTRSYAYSGPDTVGAALARVGDHHAEMTEARELERAGHDEYTRRGGWTRYFRVANAGGHVHTHTSCRNTYATTEWNWPTALSGGTDADVVDAAGALTCLTCFPDVREDIIAGRPPRLEVFETSEQRDDRQARERGAAEKRAAKIAKGVTPDGSPLVIGEWSLNRVQDYAVKTERAAELRLVDTLFALTGSRLDDGERAMHRDNAERLTDALAWKRGSTAEQVCASVAAKVDKRIARGY